jgi:hypothetical protein
LTRVRFLDANIPPISYVFYHIPGAGGTNLENVPQLACQLTTIAAISFPNVETSLPNPESWWWMQYVLFGHTAKISMRYCAKLIALRTEVL